MQNRSSMTTHNSARFVMTADGKYCFTGGHDRSVRLWNPARLDPAYPPPTQQPNRSIDVPVQHLPRLLSISTYTDGLAHAVSAVAVDTDAQTLVTGSDKAVVLHNVVTQQVIRRWTGRHTAVVNAVTTSLGAETYLSASYDATVQIWDGRSRNAGPIQVLRDAKDSVTSVLVTQDDSSSGHIGRAEIMTASVDGCIRTYDLRKGVIRTDDCSAPLTGLAATADGQCLVANGLDGALRLLERDTGDLLNTFTGHHVAGQYGLQCGVLASDATVWTGSEDGCVVLYDLVRGKHVQTLDQSRDNQKPLCVAAAHPLPARADVVATASYDGKVIVWGSDSDYIGW